MPANMRSVFSSTVSKIGHDPDTGRLHVLWKNGKLSHYGSDDNPVPASLAQEVTNAASVGKAINDRIKPAFDHEYP